MTPSNVGANGNYINFASVFYVHSYGYLSDDPANYVYHCYRPVINLRSDVLFNSESDGTQNNPYIVVS